MPLYDFKCPRCGHLERDRVTRASTELLCAQPNYAYALAPHDEPSLCGTLMERIDAVPHAVMGAGRTAQARAEFHARERKQLEARSAAYDAKGEGADARAATMERLTKKGVA